MIVGMHDGACLDCEEWEGRPLEKRWKELEGEVRAAVGGAKDTLVALSRIAALKLQNRGLWIIHGNNARTLLDGACRARLARHM